MNKKASSVYVCRVVFSVTREIQIIMENTQEETQHVLEELHSKQTTIVCYCWLQLIMLYFVEVVLLILKLSN